MNRPGRPRSLSGCVFAVCVVTAVWAPPPGVRCADDSLRSALEAISDKIGETPPGLVYLSPAGNVYMLCYIIHVLYNNRSFVDVPYEIRCSATTIALLCMRMRMTAQCNYIHAAKLVAMKMLKRLIGVTSKYRSIEVVPIVDKMRANRLRWLARVLRREETEAVRVTKQIVVESRKRGGVLAFDYNE